MRLLHSESTNVLTCSCHLPSFIHGAASLWHHWPSQPPFCNNLRRAPALTCPPPPPPVCESVRACVRMLCCVSAHSILLWLPLVPLTCHPCSMTACRRWPGMVWDMEYPWAKVDCKTLPASSTLGMMPTNILPSIHSFILATDDSL